MVIYNNLAAMSALNETNKNTNKLNKAIKKASSGMKLNSAEDDSSAYAISEKMRVQIRALRQDIENTKTGRNLIATAEGGIQNIVENLRNLKEKALDAANDHNTDKDREFIQKEVNVRLEEINDIASATNYNGRILLNGDYSRPEINSVSPDVSNLVAIGNGGYATSNSLSNLISAFRVDTAETTSGLTGPTTPTGVMGYRDIPGTLGYRSATDNLTSIMVDFSGARTASGGVPSYPADFDGQGFSMGCANCNAYASVFFDASIPASASSVKVVYNGDPSARLNYDLFSYEYTIGIQNATDNRSLSRALYDGVWAANASENSNPGGADVTQNYPLGSSAYFGMRLRPGMARGNAHQLRVALIGGKINLERGTFNEWIFYNDGAIKDPFASDNQTVVSGMGTKSLIIHTGTKANQNVRIFINDMHAKKMGVEPLEVATREQAVDAIDKVDAAIEYALNEVTYMGAYQSRLAETESVLVTNEENTTSAESVVRNADMAKTMTDYAKYDILQQTAQSMLAQANQHPQKTLTLLQQ